MKLIYETCPPLFPDLLERLGNESGNGRRFRLWSFPNVYGIDRRDDEMRGITVLWHAPDYFIPPEPRVWTVRITHYFYPYVQEGKKRVLRQRIRSTQRRFVERAACIRFLQKVLGAAWRVSQARARHLDTEPDSYLGELVGGAR
jgi:hypothetical protein